MRFVPYVGPFIAAAPPLLLAAVVEAGWTTFLLTAALYIVSEFDDGSGGGAPRLWARYGNLADRGHPRDRLLDMARARSVSS